MLTGRHHDDDPPADTATPASSRPPDRVHWRASLTTVSRSAVSTDAVRDALRARRDRVGPYAKARHVAAALEVPVQAVTPRLFALVEAGELEVWSDSPPRTYLITLGEGDHLPVDGPGKLDALPRDGEGDRARDEAARERLGRADGRSFESR